MHRDGIEFVVVLLIFEGDRKDRCGDRFVALNWNELLVFEEAEVSNA